MARFSKNEKDNKTSYAKRLYVKGFDFETIADMLTITPDTLKKWAKENDFDSAQRAANISIGEIRNEILTTYEKMKNGEKPNISPDQISKLVASFEKLTPNQKSLTWIIEAFELLTESLLTEIKKTKSAKEKEQLLLILKHTRLHADGVVNRLTKEILNL